MKNQPTPSAFVGLSLACCFLFLLASACGVFSSKLDREGGVLWLLEADVEEGLAEMARFEEVPDEQRPSVAEQICAQTRAVVESRLREAGIGGRDNIVVRDGRVTDGCRVVVVAGGLSETGGVTGRLWQRGRLWFSPVLAGPAPSEEEVLAELGGELPRGAMMVADLAEPDMPRFYAVGEPVFSNKDLETASRSMDEFNMPTVAFRMQKASSERFLRYTREHLDEQLAIVFDGQLMAAPVIKSAIPGEGRIDGNFSPEEAEELALVLRAGALPAPVVVLEERMVAPRSGWSDEQRARPWLAPQAQPR